MWNIFNTLQLVTALPDLDVSPPGNVVSIDEEFKEIVNFKIVSKDQLYSWVIEPLFSVVRVKNT